MTTAKMTVLRSEAQKVSLPKSRTKLSKPMKRAGSGEISRALVKARTNVSTIGTIKKVMISTPAGTSISRATVPRTAGRMLGPGGGCGDGLSAGTGGFVRGSGSRGSFPSLSGELGSPEPKAVSAPVPDREAAHSK